MGKARFSEDSKPSEATDKDGHGAFNRPCSASAVDGRLAIDAA